MPVQEPRIAAADTAHPFATRSARPLKKSNPGDLGAERLKNGRISSSQDPSQLGHPKLGHGPPPHWTVDPSILWLAVAVAADYSILLCFKPASRGEEGRHERVSIKEETGVCPCEGPEWQTKPLALQTLELKGCSFSARGCLTVSSLLFTPTNCPSHSDDLHFFFSFRGHHHPSDGS